MHCGTRTPEADLWRRLGALIDNAPSEDDLRSHRLEVPAARRFRLTERPVPEDFVAQERLAAVALLTAPLLLERIRAVASGPLLVLKGPEVAAHYTDPALRGFGDVDVLTDDADRLQQELIAAGFVEIGEPELYEDIHHLRPLAADGLPLAVEVHSRPKWIESLAPPSTRELLEAAVPGASGVAGVHALPPELHAILLAAHSWAHEPLRRLRDLVDVAAVAACADRRETARIAATWGVERLWEATIAAADAILGPSSRPWSVRLWAQNLDRARERTVLESHLQRWLSDFWVLPPVTAFGRLPRTLANELGRDDDEAWREKLARTSLAVRNASQRRSRHDRELEERSRDAAAG